jgi:uncharacterized membrane protein/sporulation protein YlmC with PRC-barrel domain
MSEISIEANEQKIPEDTAAIKPGIAVEAIDGHVGTVGDVVVAPESGEVTHFSLQTGSPRGQEEISLPLSAVDHVGGDTVYLKLDKQALGQLPAVPLQRGSARGTEEAAKIDLVAVAFDAPEDAGQALKFVERFQKQGTLKVLNAAVLVKDAEGNVTIKDTRDIDPKKGRRLGAVTGGLIGLVGGPVGAVVGALAGVGAGGLAGKKIDFGFSDQFLDGLKQYLKPNTSALILLVEHAYYQQLSEVIAEEEGVFFRQTLTDKLVEQLLAGGEQEEPAQRASNIVVLGFENRYGAEAMLDDVHKWQQEGLIEVEDAVLADAGPDGRVKIRQTHRSDAGKFALRGGGVGLVAGALVGGPILGLVAGVAAGSIRGKRAAALKDQGYGLDDDFVQAASGWVRAERSALFLLVKQADAEGLGGKLLPLKATVLTTTLAPEQEQRLRQALAEEDF